MRSSPSKLKRRLPQSKIDVTSKSPVGNVSVVTLTRTDTTLDHSQKAEKVCIMRVLYNLRHKLCNKTLVLNDCLHGILIAPQLSKHINQMIEKPSIIGAIVV